ncbi:integral membrane sensor signal transduction histidine kinase [Pseudopedobacter saltans DSM 12145]|uniref:histidine kinase n=1 Tax=Pseudopedobacter saltans (strain ATCC 51119 / DSM 12145 / JCM 21818 / CCUG 39354 / LMG 10337 / NBRC 100064 / NCIMB 13643) TaxID=762903 RepID=F0S776_PSESL|nr:HAMP domain-containing sensor histidine kinase [Pseudopedobacter saltans]ADY54349.1 integral membrane sensor signal transduction histidine kinase [Pseudopedobacter saltans DSM 12145]
MGLDRLRIIWNKIIGSKEDFELSSRFFHHICVFGMVALFINIPLNIYIGLPLLTFVLIIVLIGLFFCYYLSRFRDRYEIAILIFEMMSTAFAAIHFFFSSGINGAGLLYFLLFFFLNITVAPRRQYPFWLLLNLILVAGALVIEYNYPYLIENQYETKIERFYDLFIAYFITLVMLLLLVREIWKSYFIEKNGYEKRTKELAKLNEEKSKLFSIVAHDLRSPILSIKGYLESLNAISFSEEEKNLINKKLLEDTISANEMMDNLLTWVKNQLDGVEPNLLRFKLADNLKITIDLCRNSALNKNINLTVNIDEDVDIVADREMIKVVVRNLLVNAIKFTGEGGNVLLKAENKDGNCLIHITDNGIGFSNSDKKAVFSHRLKSKTGTRNEKGTALGLIICRDYTLIQKGKIAMQSKEGMGTTFTLTFPA